MARFWQHRLRLPFLVQSIPMSPPVSTDLARPKSVLESVLVPLVILGLLYAFVCAINVMGAGLKILAQAPATEATVQGLFARAANPVAGLFVGILVTSFVQSSSFTTSLTVGLVATGQISVVSAVPIVMGANIGTSVTNILVSLGHVSARLEFRRAFGAAIVHDIFNVLTVVLILPIELTTHALSRTATILASVFISPTETVPSNPLKAATKPVVDGICVGLEHLLAAREEWIGAIMGLAGLLALLLSLVLLVRVLKRLILTRLEAFFARYFFRNWALALTLGLCVTVMVQSSSVTTSLVVPLAGAGVLRLQQVFPYTLGANIGTTVTSLLAAAATGTPAGLAVAFAHLLFNTVGTAVFLPLRAIPIGLAHWYATLAATRRGLALLYLVVVFFVLPILCIMLTR